MVTQTLKEKPHLFRSNKIHAIDFNRGQDLTLKTPLLSRPGFSFYHRHLYLHARSRKRALSPHGETTWEAPYDIGSPRPYLRTPSRPAPAAAPPRTCSRSCRWCCSTGTRNRRSPPRTRSRLEERRRGAWVSCCCPTESGYHMGANPAAFITAYSPIINFSVPIRRTGVNQYKMIPLVTCSNP